jgi:hypothetical protein
MNSYIPPPRALILCTDERLSRLLETELAYLGISARATDSLTRPDGELCLLLADGDTFPPADCASLAHLYGCPLLIFGQEPAEPPSLPKGCACLRRPFPLTELESALRRLLSDTPTVGPLAERPTARPAAPDRAPPPALSLEQGHTTVHGVPLSLTPAEQAILEHLYTHRGETVPRAELATLLEGGGNSVEVSVCRLRAKIEKPLGRRMIHTVRGVGYRLEKES